MNKKTFLLSLVCVLCIALAAITLACVNKGQEETITTYTYSFTVDSTDYTYELSVSSQNYCNLKLKEGSTSIYDFNEFHFAIANDTIEGWMDDGNEHSEKNSLKLKLNSDDTFEVTSVAGDFFNLILGYEIYAGEYTITSENQTFNVTLNSNGTALIDNKPGKFLPWNGSKVIISNDAGGAVCEVDFQNHVFTMEGGASNDMEYIFDATKYDFDFASLLSTDNQRTELYLSEKSNKAYFKKTVEQENSPVLYDLTFGSYEKANKTVTFASDDTNLSFITEGFLFDYSYTEHTQGTNWIKLYNQNDLTVYGNANTILVGDTVFSDSDIYVFTSVDKDNFDAETTYVIDSTSLNPIEIYYGEFKGLEGNVTYLSSENDELIIVDDETYYYYNGEEAQTKVYSSYSYTKDIYDSNAIINEHQMKYYLFDGAFYNYPPPTIEQKEIMIENPTHSFYGKNVTEDTSTFILALLLNSYSQKASIIMYALGSGDIGNIQFKEIITGDYTLESNIYTITADDDMTYTITTDEGKITEFSIIA